MKLGAVGNLLYPPAQNLACFHPRVASVSLSTTTLPPIAPPILESSFSNAFRLALRISRPGSWGVKREEVVD